MRRVAVLGSTGSVGSQSLDVIRALPDRLEVVALSAHRAWELLCSQARAHRPRRVTLTDDRALRKADRALLGPGVELITGSERLERLVTDAETEMVLVAVVGAAGLNGTWAALQAGKTVAMANKETLVLAGSLIMQLARQRGARILPVDSEHSAVLQAMNAGRLSEVRRVILTASGGPFRHWTARRLRDVTPAQALRHPTWRMGRKITIDSATMMNKALEVIEARWLFDLSPDQIEVVVHPESVMHSLVEFVDGSVIAQLAQPDMRLPIQHALCYPDRVRGPTPVLELASVGALSFEPADPDRFPALKLGYEVARLGGTAGAVLNAANEVAVARFLAGTIRFTDIASLCRAVLEEHPFDPQPILSQLVEADRWARIRARYWRPARSGRAVPRSSRSAEASALSRRARSSNPVPIGAR